MLSAACRLLKSFLRFQAGLDLLDGSSYYSPVRIRHQTHELSIVSELGLTGVCLVSLK